MGRMRPLYGAGHDSNDVYHLQEFVKGNWHYVRKCDKQGGANTARAQSKKDGHPYRVYNITKSKVYVECG